MKLLVQGLVSLLLLGLVSTPLYAVNTGMTTLASSATDGDSHTATFALGLTVDGGKSWQSTASLNQVVTLKGSLDPDTEHVGKVADIFVVRRSTGGLAMLTAPNTWSRWSGKTADLQPFVDDTILQATQELVLHQGSIIMAGEHRLYMAYRPTGTDTLIYSSAPAILQFAAGPRDPLDYFSQEIVDDFILTRCAMCHVAGGVAGKSRLQFVKDSTRDQENYDNFKGFYRQLGTSGYNYVLGKVSGTAHVGGNQLPLGSTGYQKLATFLDLLDGATGTTAQQQSLFDDVIPQYPADTLRDAALLLGGRLPTAAEIALVTANGETGLRSAVLALMQGPDFHKFLKDAAEDRLFLRGNPDFNLMDDCAVCYPQLVEHYWQLKDAIEQDDTAANRAALALWLNQINYSAIESPLELIAYVVENDRPYTEILTADYDMLTPVLNAVVGGTASFAANAGNTDFAPGRITDYHLRDSGTVTHAAANASFPHIETPPALVTGYPHAGVLSSKSFLSRYPSTATNRNRARARWAYMNFLGVDIESQAARTTDPVALADTNNPTMNNPACTVCHTVLDPVAGAFQLFNDNGTFRSAINGTDSLDGTYKAARNPRLHVAGDTWYRDMRAPGFEGSPAPADSLRWLGQQMAKDKRFAAATVKFWWAAVIGSDLLKAPEVAADFNYKARLAAYEAQQAEISQLAARFTQSGYSLKQLLAELVLSKWYRAEQLSGKPAATDAAAARALASVSGEKLLTPALLAAKTRALTGFNWGGQRDAVSGLHINGLDKDYNTFYGGIDGFALKVRARGLTPLMSNVAATHAIESSCPIVLGDFIRPQSQRLLFAGLTPWVTPLTEHSSVKTLTDATETEFKNYTTTTTLTPGTHQIVVSLLNDGCDYSSSPGTCKADKNLLINTLTVTKPGGQSTTFNGNRGSFGVCAAVIGGTRLSLNASCSATYDYTADQAGLYTITASLAARQQSGDPVMAALNVEATNAMVNVTTAGAALIKQRLAEIHGKLLGQRVTVTSPEVLASYDLLVQTWSSRKAGNYPPSLLNKTLACDWASDSGFIGSLGYPGSPLQANGRYNTAAVTAWLLPQAQDPLLMKQSWAVVMAYLLTHYDYLHE